MQCNIGAKGKAVRLKMGILALGFSILLSGVILTGILDSVTISLNTSKPRQNGGAF